MTKFLVNVADIIDPNDVQGRTYRQINAAKEHQIPFGALVEVTEGSQKGEQLFVVLRNRDCDQTPLYCLGTSRRDEDVEPAHFWEKFSWTMNVPESCLKIVSPTECSI